MVLSELKAKVPNAFFSEGLEVKAPRKAVIVKMHLPSQPGQEGGEMTI